MRLRAGFGFIDFFLDLTVALDTLLRICAGCYELCCLTLSRNQ